MDLDAAIVTCMILISDLTAHAVIDYGASHYFIYVAYVANLGIIPDRLFIGYSVSLPSREELKSNNISKKCRIQM